MVPEPSNGCRVSGSEQVPKSLQGDRLEARITEERLSLPNDFRRLATDVFGIATVGYTDGDRA